MSNIFFQTLIGEVTLGDYPWVEYVHPHCIIKLRVIGNSYYQQVFIKPTPRFITVKVKFK